MMRSKARAIDDQIADDGKGAGPPRLDDDRVAVVESPHVELAGRRLARRAVGLAVDHHAAGAANPLAAIVVERDRLLPVLDQLLVEHVEHLQKRHVGRDVVELVGLELARATRAPAAARFSKSAKGSDVMITCNSAVARWT